MLASKSHAAPRQSRFPEIAWIQPGKVWMIPLVFFLLLQLMPVAFSGLKKSIFCAPASSLAGLVLGAGQMKDGAGYPLLLLPEISLRVGESCSGYDFFSLLCVVFLWLALRRKSHDSAPLVSGLLFVWLPLAFLATLLANISRLCCLAVLSLPLRNLIPENGQSLAHCTVGIFVFLPYLLLFVLLNERLSHVFRKKSS